MKRWSLKNSHKYLPYTIQRFWCFQISLINNSRHPRDHCIHESSMVLGVSGVPSLVTTFPPYILKTRNLKKNLSTLNLTWKPLNWNSAAPKILVLTGTMEVPGIPGVLGFYEGTRFLGGPGIPRLSGVLWIPGILELWSLNWFCKHIEKIGSSQGFILTNSWTGLPFYLWVSVKAEFILWRNYGAHEKIYTLSVTLPSRDNFCGKLYTLYLLYTYKIKIILFHFITIH